jgi:hypothetical protein
MPKFRKMTKRTVFFLMTLIWTLPVTGQTNDNEIRRQVLEKNVVDSLFVFGKWTKDGDTETHLKYLGQVKTIDGKTYKIMNSVWFWGLSHRATNRILIFDEKNQYVGNYSLKMTYDLPDKLENGKLVFSNKKKENCDKEIITAIDFSKGIPKEIFMKCEGETGELYVFTLD